MADAGKENKVKEPYVTPELEIIEFENEDVITTSNIGGVESGDDV